MAKEKEVNLLAGDYIIPSPKIGEVVPLHPDTARRLSKAGQFPPLIIISPRKHGYLASEVFDWLRTRRG